MKTINWLKKSWQLIKPFWKGEDKNIALVLTVSIIILIILETCALVKITKWTELFYNIIQNYEKTSFVGAISKGFFIFLLYILFTLAKYYFSSLLEIRWRKWLSDFYITNWLGKKTYYNLKILDFYPDNPDQRISEDISTLVILTVSIVSGIFKSIIDSASFTVLLWNLSGSFSIHFLSIRVTIPGYMVWIAILYSFIGTCLVFNIGKKLIKLNYEKENCEAGFRNTLIRVREYMDHIAAYGGEEIEKTIATHSFNNIVDNFMQLLHRNLKINAFNFIYSHLSGLIPIIISVGRYLAKEMTLGGLMQVSSAFGQLQAAISYFIFTYPNIAAWRASVNRLLDLKLGMERIKSSIKISPVTTLLYDDKIYLRADKLNIRTPTGVLLVSGFSISLSSSEKLLIQGATGCGKSTLIKTLNGLWPYYEGEIYNKAKIRSLFIFQKPYFPNCNLKECICYPEPELFTKDDEIIHLLIECKMKYLVDMLYKKHDWSNRLSLGEQQKIALCRVLINRPDIVYLDEASSALDEDAEKYFYSKIIKLLPNTVIVSVTHRSTLGNFHTKSITL